MWCVDLCRQICESNLDLIGPSKRHAHRFNTEPEGKKETVVEVAAMLRETHYSTLAPIRPSHLKKKKKKLIYFYSDCANIQILYKNSLRI